jgi:hypothetical protein
MRPLLVITHRVMSVTDPLGPVDQDPDQVRETACKLVAPDLVCAPPKPRPPSPSSTPGDVSWLNGIAWVVLAVLIGVLLWLAWRAVQQFSGRARPAKAKKQRAADDDPIDDLGEVVAVDWSRSPQQWRAEADEHRQAGRWRDSLRCRYRALVGDLARRGLIDEIPGRTSGEERVQLTAVASAAHDPFSAAADLFDDAWFGDREVGQGDDDEFRRYEAEVLQITGKPEARSGSRVQR